MITINHLKLKNKDRENSFIVDFFKLIRKYDIIDIDIMMDSTEYSRLDDARDWMKDDGEFDIDDVEDYFFNNEGDDLN